MQLNVPSDLEALINKRLSSGAYISVEDVLRRALETQDAVETFTEEECRYLSAHIEEGWLQAERGELIDAADARRELQKMKRDRQAAPRPENFTLPACRMGGGTMPGVDINNGAELEDTLNRHA